MKRTLVVSALTAVLTLTLSAGASAQTDPPVPPPPDQGTWLPVFYFGTQTYCGQAGMMGQSIGVLTPGGWKCDSGWLMKRLGGGGQPPVAGPQPH